MNFTIFLLLHLILSILTEDVTKKCNCPLGKGFLLNGMDEKNSASSIKDPQCLNCNLSIITPKKVINPYKSELQNMVRKTPFGSFCVKCVACLAVANEIDDVIKTIVRDCTVKRGKQSNNNENLSEKINELCSRGFEKYDFRAYHQHNILTDMHECTRHVEIKAAGDWTNTLLRSLCSLYTSFMDLEHISYEYLNSGRDLKNELCKSSGIFRDCVNLSGHENITFPNRETCSCAICTTE